MIRFRKRVTAAAVVLIIAAAGSAQDTPRTPEATQALRIAAEKRSAEWEVLAKALDTKISRMLPCDPRVKESIEEVVHASQARMRALAEVMKASAEQAASDVAKLQFAMSAEDANLADAEAERAEAMQERLAVDGQLADLADSARRRQSLEDARTVLADIDAKVSARATLAEQQTQVRAALALSMRDLLVAALARQRELTIEQGALAVETTRWSEYYTARLARAQVECTITGASKSSKKKKKSQ
jgi:hypothetical protein